MARYRAVCLISSKCLMIIVEKVKLMVTEIVKSVFDVSNLNVRVLHVPTHIIFDINCEKIWHVSGPNQDQYLFWGVGCCFCFLSVAMQFKSFPVLRNDD